jgi:hypothetical protein
VSAPPAAGVVASDDFTRTGSRWGTADTGGAWTDSGASYFATSGGKGTVTVSKAGSGPVATLGGVSVLDSTTTAEFSLDKAPNGSGYYFGLGARKQGTSQYRLKVRVLSDGSVHLLTTSVVGGTETTLKESAVSGLTYTPGTVLKVRFQVSGTGTTTLTGKVWKASGTEPTTAQVSSTSTVAGLQSAGSPEVQGYLSGSSTSIPIVASVDSYRVISG